MPWFVYHFNYILDGIVLFFSRFIHAAFSRRHAVGSSVIHLIFATLFHIDIDTSALFVCTFAQTRLWQVNKFVFNVPLPKPTPKKMETKWAYNEL